MFKARPKPGPAGPGRSALSPHNSPRQREPGEDVGSLSAGQAAFIHLREVARISYGWRTDEDRAVIDLEWQLQRVGGHPLTHKQVLKADGSTDTLPLPPICVTALRIARRNQDQAQARTADWPDTCICGEKHSLVFTTRTGRPVEPRNINRAFDVRCTRYIVRRITLHDTRRTCGSLLAALDVHPRIAMAILRHSRIALTMEICTQVPDKVTRDALRRLSDWLDHDEDQGDEARS